MVRWAIVGSAILALVGCNNAQNANDTIPQTGTPVDMKKVGNVYIYEPTPSGRVPADYGQPQQGAPAPAGAGTGAGQAPPADGGEAASTGGGGASAK